MSTPQHTDQTLTVSINGEVKMIAANLSLLTLLEQYHYADKKVAVAINEHFIPRSAYGNTVLHAQDCIDIVSPVGGG